MYVNWTAVFICLLATAASCSSPERGPVPIFARDVGFEEEAAPEVRGLSAKTAEEPPVIVESEAKLYDPPQRGDLVITELMVNPHAVPDHMGEYVELKSLAPHTIGLNGLVLRDNDADFHVVEGKFSVPEGGLFVLARSTDFKNNGGVKADYAYGGSFSLANGDDEVIIEYAEITVDEVEYDSTWAMPDGAALELDPLLTDPGCNDIEDLWCKAEVPLAGGDTGSPGVENKGCE